MNIKIPIFFILFSISQITQALNNFNLTEQSYNISGSSSTACTASRFPFPISESHGTKLQLKSHGTRANNQKYARYCRGTLANPNGCHDNDFFIWYSTNPNPCPTNSNYSNGACSTNTGFNAVNTGTTENPNWTVVSQGNECQPGTTYNPQNGTCGEPLPPPPPDCTTKTTKKIYPYTFAQGCPNSDGENFQSNCTDYGKPLPTFYCDAGCQYNFINTPTALHECYSLPSENHTKVYCENDAQGTGTNCSDVSITIDNSNSIPQSTTPAINQSINSGGTNAGSSSNPSGSTQSLGGTGTNNAGGGSTPTNGTSPTRGTQQSTTATQGSTNCDGCATEGTQAQVLKSLTDVQGGVTAPTLETGITSNDLGGMLVNNDKIQGMFRLNIPAHDRTCPTFNISIPYLNLNQTMDSHCLIMADHYQTIRNLGITAWIITAIIVILGA